MTNRWRWWANIEVPRAPWLDFFMKNAEDVVQQNLKILLPTPYNGLCQTGFNRFEAENAIPQDVC